MPEGSFRAPVTKGCHAEGLMEALLGAHDRGCPVATIVSARSRLRVSVATRTARRFGRVAMRDPGKGPTSTYGGQVKGNNLVRLALGAQASKEEREGARVSALVEAPALRVVLGPSPESPLDGDLKPGEDGFARNRLVLVDYPKVAMGQRLLPTVGLVGNPTNPSQGGDGCAVRSSYPAPRSGPRLAEDGTPHGPHRVAVGGG